MVFCGRKICPFPQFTANFIIFHRKILVFTIFLTQVVFLIKKVWKVNIPPFFQFFIIVLKLPVCFKLLYWKQTTLSLNCRYMTYGCQTWSLSKAMGQKLRTAQRAMERKMLNLKIKDKVPYTEIRKRTRVQDIVQFVLKQKWKWAGHVARLDDNRWTQRVTEWQPREGRRSRGRQRKRWRDDLVQLKGVTWRHDAQHRQRWRSDVEGYFQQWKNTAL